MILAIVIVTLILFLIIDLSLRFILMMVEQSKIRKKRQEALDIGLKLQFSEEASSLKRVEVDNPRAKILAVDDEQIVLDSLREIAVMAGYSIDTVDCGPDALTLVRKNDYDFIFTDLKMPDMDGIEVTKAARHLRPDIDVIIVTGFATIESAVATMKYGAMDYIQKPFTNDELTEFMEKALLRRQDRIEREMRPGVRLVTASAEASGSRHDFNIPAGAFISPGHVWGSIQMNGLVKIGIDDFAGKLIGKIDDIDFPREGRQVRRGDPICTVKRNSMEATFISPLSGKIGFINPSLPDNINLITKKPYEDGWICVIEPSDLNSDIRGLKIGPDAATWFQQEIDRFTKIANRILSAESEESAEKKSRHIVYYQMDDGVWSEFKESFLLSTEFIY